MPALTRTIFTQLLSIAYIRTNIFHYGIFKSIDRGKTLKILGINFPMSSVSDIEIHKETNEMVVSTHGRGIYKINLKPIHSYYSMQESLNSDFLFTVNNAYLPKFNDTHKEPLMDTYEKIPISFLLDNNTK